MEILIIWLFSIIISYIMEIISDSRLYKDVADAGYLVNIRKTNEVGNNLNLNNSKINFLKLLIPIINIFTVFENTINYNKNRNKIIDTLSIYNILEDMTNEEQEKYIENPTCFNALKINIQHFLTYALAYAMKISLNGKHSEITYKVEPEKDDITILKTAGYASTLPLEEQKRMVMDTWQLTTLQVFKNTSDIEEIINIIASKNLNVTDAHQDKDDANKVYIDPETIKLFNERENLIKLKEELETLKNHTSMEEKAVILDRKKE